MTHKHQLICLPGDDLFRNVESPQRSWKGYEVIDVFTGFNQICAFIHFLTFIEFLLCAKQRISAKFGTIHDKSKMLEKDITLVPKAFHHKICKPSEADEILLIKYFKSDF